VFNTPNSECGISHPWEKLAENSIFSI